MQASESKKKVAKKTEATGCKCLQQINEQLAPLGARLQTGLSINFKTGEASITGPFLAVERVGKGKKKLPTVVCTYCPCCGKKKPE